MMLPTFKANLQIISVRLLRISVVFAFTFLPTKNWVFEHQFILWEKTEVAGSQVWKIGWVLKHSDVVIR
jgi:hypothetical protein